MAMRASKACYSKVAFIGLGRMGVKMAQNLLPKYEVVGFDVSEAGRTAASAHFEVASTLHESTANADFVVSSLPVSAIVEDTVDDIMAAGALKEGAVWVDTTSGVPSVSNRIWTKLDSVGVKFLDCGVAGGPLAAEKGTLSAMVGGESGDLAKVQPLLDMMMAKVVHIGPVGSGHAVKAVNNTLLATNIWTTYEGLIILARMGVDLEKALDAINCSSGRSLVTEERVPRHVLNRKFDFGFSLGLMRKDVEICMRAINDLDIPSPVLRQIAAFWQIGEVSLGKDVDHMEVVKILEEMSGARVEKKNKAWPNLQTVLDDTEDLESVQSAEMELNALMAQVKAKKAQLQEREFPLRSLTSDAQTKS